MTSLPPFLEKLKRITETCDPKYGHWCDKGTEFFVCSDEFEDKILSQFFKGNLKTFIRQLHFYSFKKSETVGGVWSFSHPKFRRDNPELINDIKRKTRLSTVTFTSKQEFEALKHVVDKMRKQFEGKFADVDKRLAQLAQAVESQITTQDCLLRSLGIMPQTAPGISPYQPNPVSFPMRPPNQSTDSTDFTSSSNSSDSPQDPSIRRVVMSSQDKNRISSSSSGTKLISAANLQNQNNFPGNGNNSSSASNSYANVNWNHQRFPSHVGPQVSRQIQQPPPQPQMIPIGGYNSNGQWQSYNFQLPKDILKKKRKKVSKKQKKAKKRNNDGPKVKGGIPLDDFSLSRVPNSARYS